MRSWKKSSLTRSGNGIIVDNDRFWVKFRRAEGIEAIMINLSI
jgi:hypothetical protein